MPTQLPSNIQYEHFLKLPEQLRDAISSVNTADIIFEVGREHKFTIEKIGILGHETGLVMSGISPAKDFPGALMGGLGISREETNAIVQELNQKIFLPIREYLKGFHGPKWEEDLRVKVDSGEGQGERGPLRPRSEASKGITDTIRRPPPPGGPEPLIINPMQRPMTPIDVGALDREQRAIQSDSGQAVSSEPARAEGVGAPGIMNHESIRLPDGQGIRDGDIKSAKSVETAEPKETEPAPVSPVIRGFTAEDGGEGQVARGKRTADSAMVAPVELPKPSSPLLPQLPMADIEPLSPIPPMPNILNPKTRYEETKQLVEKELVEFKREADSGKGVGVRDDVLGAADKARGTNHATAQWPPINQPAVIPPVPKPMVTESSEPVRPSPYVIAKDELQRADSGKGVAASVQPPTTQDGPVSPLASAIPPAPPTAPVAPATPLVTPSIQAVPPIQTPTTPVPPAAPQVIAPAPWPESPLNQNPAAPTAPPSSSPQAPNQSPAPNPIRIEKKIPKPPAPERYDVDPYKEEVE